MGKIRRKRLNYSQKRAFSGLLFCLPFIIGFLMFFLVPMVQSIIYAFSSFSFTENGMESTFVGLKNFREALFADPQYIRTIVTSLQQMALQVPIIVLFSLFAAILLNGKFRGRTAARAIFFLPVIIVSGVILEILSTDYLAASIMSGEQTVGAFRGVGSYEILQAIGIPSAIIDVLVPVVYNIFNLVWNSGVQILIFLAGLQTVPRQLYESAQIEGSTAWETFWKITFPLISPMMLMNVIFTIIDYFTTSMNPVIQMINQQSSNLRFEYAAGLAWMYLIVVFIFVGIIYALLNKRIVYVGN